MERGDEMEKWTGFHANKLPHMGNRSSNRVETTHAKMKQHIQTSSGKMDLVTNKILEWWKIRVSSFDN